MSHRDYAEWLERGDIRPYVYMRKSNRPKAPGSRHVFPFPLEPIEIDPAQYKNAAFAYQILKLENTVFAKTGLTLPRWAFYDCAVMPGLTVGFAAKQSSLPKSMRKAITVDPSLEWVPLSLFIAIPTAEKDHWVANNLCSINSLLPKEESLEGLGFLSKVFGLWYGNIHWLYGVTQWGNPALKVHTYYGRFQLETAFTPIHDITTTLTYKVEVDDRYWRHFLEEAGPAKQMESDMEDAGIVIGAKSESDARSLQERIERGEGPFFLDAASVGKEGVERFKIYRRKNPL